MNYKIPLIVLLTFLFACEQRYTNLEYNSNFENFSNKGFALIYDEQLYKNKIVNKKIDERSLIIFNNKLKYDTPVKVTNLLNGKYILAKIGKKSKYPFFYNAVISKRIAEELEIDLSEPYIAVQTINTSGAFVAKKAKTFKEEKKVADKAPVDGITIENLGDETNKIKKTNKLKLKKKEFNYIIKFADLYFEDSALILKKRLIDEYNLSNISIDKINNNVYRVYKGPFDNIKSIKIEFDKINLMDFDNIDIIKL